MTKREDELLKMALELSDMNNDWGENREEIGNLLLRALLGRNMSTWLLKLRDIRRVR